MATATYICSSELKFFIQLQKSFSASFARSARAVPMDFFGMESTWADDGVEDSEAPGQEAPAQAGVQETNPSNGSGAAEGAVEFGVLPQEAVASAPDPAQELAASGWMRGPEPQGKRSPLTVEAAAYLPQPARQTPLLNSARR